MRLACVAAVLALPGLVTSCAWNTSGTGDDPESVTASQLDASLDRLVLISNDLDSDAYADMLCARIRKVYADNGSQPSPVPVQVISREAPAVTGPDDGHLTAMVRYGAIGSVRRAEFAFTREDGQLRYCPEAVWVRKS